MMRISRRSILSAIACALPFGIGSRLTASAPLEAPPRLQFRSFENAVREAFANSSQASLEVATSSGEAVCRRRIEVGHSEQIRAGVQGCVNDRAFAGFRAGCLRIVRSGSEPGPVRQGVRLYITTVDVALTKESAFRVPGRPLNFASLPPAPAFSSV